MGTFYTDEQIQEAVAALEDHTAGIFERMKKLASVNDPFSDEQEAELGAVVRVLTIVLPKVSYVVQAEDKNEARARLSIDLGDVVRAALASDEDDSQ
ncbi:Na+/phosphate symporter [Bradyrhizobium sp. F1.13.1]